MTARVLPSLAPHLRPGAVGEVLPHGLEGEFPVLIRFGDGAVGNYREEEVERRPGQAAGEGGEREGNR